MAENALTMVLALVAIVAIIFALSIVVRRLQGVRTQQSSGIELITSRMLGPKERLLLVQVGRRQILVGMNTQCINALAEFDAAEQTFDDALQAAVVGEAHGSQARGAGEHAA